MDEHFAVVLDALRSLPDPHAVWADPTTSAHLAPAIGPRWGNAEQPGQCIRLEVVALHRRKGHQLGTLLNALLRGHLARFPRPDRGPAQAHSTRHPVTPRAALRRLL